MGVVASLARPGGNVTGLSVQSNELAGKRIELLREVVPGLRRLAILGNVGNPFTVLELAGMLASLIDGRLFLAHSYPSLRSIEAINLIGD